MEHSNASRLVLVLLLAQAAGGFSRAEVKCFSAFTPNCHVIKVSLFLKKKQKKPPTQVILERTRVILRTAVRGRAAHAWRRARRGEGLGRPPGAGGRRARKHFPGPAALLGQSPAVPPVIRFSLPGAPAAARHGCWGPGAGSPAVLLGAGQRPRSAGWVRELVLLSPVLLPRLVAGKPWKSLCFSPHRFPFF